MVRRRFDTSGGPRSSRRGSPSGRTTARHHSAPTPESESDQDAGESLQSLVGNHAVARMLAPTVARTIQREADGEEGDFWARALEEQKAETKQVTGLLVADADPAFNPDSVVNDLRRAIDQSELTMTKKVTKEGSFLTGEVAVGVIVRKVDAAKVIGALDNLTARQVAIVDRLYEHREGRRIAEDLFGKGESNADSNLTPVERQRIRALLRGTKAESATGPAAGKALDARLEADASEIEKLVEGGLGKEANLERVMALHRRPPEQIDVIDAWYQRHSGRRLFADLESKLEGLQMQRMRQLRIGNVVNADACAIEVKRREADELRTGFVTPGMAEEYGTKLKDIEGIVERNRKEALAGAAAEGKTGSQAVQARLTSLMNVKGTVEGTTLGGTIASTFGAAGMLIVGEAQRTTMQQHALDLLRMELDHSIRAEKLATILRQIRSEASADVLMQAQNPALPEADKKRLMAGTAAETTRVAKEYTREFRRSYDAMRGDGRSYEEILDQTTEVVGSYLRGLTMNGGEVNDIAALEFAVERGNGEGAKAILARQRSKEDVDRLESMYNARHDKSLRTSLFGAYVTGEARNGYDAAVRDPFATETKGLLTGRDALLATESLSKPAAADLGGQKEVDWIASGGGGELDVTMANRGALGRIRELTGDPETEAILKETAGDLQAMAALWKETKDPAQRKRILFAMRKVRATLTGDAAAYEKENEQLVAQIRAAVSIAAQIALALVLPGAGSFIGTMSLQIGATVATNLVIYGDTYDITMLRNDILGGLAGGAGGALGKVVGKEVGLAAEQIVARIGAPIADAASAAAKSAGIVSKLSAEAGGWAVGTAATTAVTGQDGFTDENAGIAVATGLIGHFRQPTKPGGAGTASGDAPVSTTPSESAPVPAPEPAMVGPIGGAPEAGTPAVPSSTPASGETASPTAVTPENSSPQSPVDPTTLDPSTRPTDQFTAVDPTTLDPSTRPTDQFAAVDPTTLDPSTRPTDQFTAVDPTTLDPSTRPTDQFTAVDPNASAPAIPDNSQSTTQTMAAVTAPSEIGVTNVSSEYREGRHARDANSPTGVTGPQVGSYVGKAGFSVERVLNGDVMSKEVTVKVYLHDAGAGPAGIAAIKANMSLGIDNVYNGRDYQLADGDRLQVRVEFVDSPGEANAVVTAQANGGRADQMNWFADNDPTTLAHEIGHHLGLPDEYVEPSSEQHPAKDRATPESPGVYAGDRSAMGNYFIDSIGTPDPGARLHDRHLNNLDNAIWDQRLQDSLREQQHGSGASSTQGNGTQGNGTQATKPAGVDAIGPNGEFILDAKAVREGDNLSAFAMELKQLQQEAAVAGVEPVVVLNAEAPALARKMARLIVGDFNVIIE